MSEKVRKFFIKRGNPSTPEIDYWAKEAQAYIDKKNTSFKEQMDIEAEIVKKHYEQECRREGVLEGLRLAKVIFKELLGDD